MLMGQWEKHGRYFSKAEALVEGTAVTRDNPNYFYRVLYKIPPRGQAPWVLEVRKVSAL